MRVAKTLNSNNMNLLAIDIGASSGRHIVESNGKLHEVYRFATGFNKQDGHLINDVETLTANVIEGIKRAFERFGSLTSLSIDTWGVDYVLMRGEKEILPCYGYRDSRTRNVVEKVHSVIPFDELYAATGIQYQQFNTIYQLYADKLSNRLDEATDFLMLPEYLNYVLTGNKVKEYTNATTTGLVNAKTKQFDSEIIRKLGLPHHLFPLLSQPKTYVGNLKKEIVSIVGGQTKVLLCASHDTASAVEGIPMTGNEPYISSGTWSLLGVKTHTAITDENSRKANFSNEGGVGYNRYQKNIMGMWVVTQLQKELCPDTDIAEIVVDAKTSNYCQIVDVNDNAFLSPKSMKQAFDDTLNTQKKPLPTQAKDYFNCAFLSLARSYQEALVELERNTRQGYKSLYIVGGGAKNAYLNELTEKYTQKHVISLPIEATALGNLKVQREANND